MNVLASLSTEALASLPSQPQVKKALILSYVQGQKAHAKTYATEGAVFSATWNCGTPERDEDDPLPVGKSAFDTPVLKPRVATPGTQSLLDESISMLNIHDPDVRAKAPQKSSRKRDLKSKKQSRQSFGIPRGKEKKRANSIDDQQERAFRLAERRERKRAKHAIVQPAEMKASGDQESSSGSGKRDFRARKAVQKGRKAKIPASFALLHGFTATNLGTQRLTLQPTALGVFSKGKASAKTNVTNKKSRPKGKQTNVFSELDFLNKNTQHPTKRPPSSLALSIADSGSTCSAPSIRSTKKKKYVITNKIGSKNRKVQPECDTGINDDNASTLIRRRKSGESKHMGSQPDEESEVWDIEKEEYPTERSASPLTQVGTVILDTRALGWSKPQASVLHAVTHPNGSESVEDLAQNRNTGCHHSVSSTLAPSDSASRNPCRESQRLKTALVPEAVSKYFACSLSKSHDVTSMKGVSLKPDAISPPASHAARISQDLAEPTPAHVSGHPANAQRSLLGTKVLACPSNTMAAFKTVNGLAGYSSFQNAASSPSSLEHALEEYEADECKGFYRGEYLRSELQDNENHPVLEWRHETMDDFERDDINGFDLFRRHEADETNDAPSAGSQEPWQHFDEYVTDDDARDDCISLERYCLQYDSAYGRESPLFGREYDEIEGHWQDESDGLETHELFEAESAGSQEIFYATAQGHSEHLDQDTQVACSDVSSHASDEDDIYPIGQFSQGRALLLGVTPPSAPEPGHGHGLSKPKAFNAIARAEKDVANALRGHWRPLKL